MRDPIPGNSQTRSGLPTSKIVSKMTMCWTRWNTQGWWPQWRVYFKTISLIITLIEILNPTGSATSSCLRNLGKLGTTKATEKRRSRDPGYIWITSPETTVEEKVNNLGTMTEQIKPGSKNLQIHSGKWSRRDLPTSPLVEENRKNWWTSKTLHAVLWWDHPPRNGANYHLLASCSAKP